MNKTLLTMIMTAACMNVTADTNNCDYSLNYDINISDTEVRYSNVAGDNLLFTKNKLIINGNTASLTHQQILSSKHFQSETRKLLPKIAEVAIEGAELGLKAATIAMAALVGDDKSVQNDFIKPIEAITNKVKLNITAKSLNTSTIESLFEKEFEQQIEAMVKKVISQYSGKIISDVIGSIFSGDSEDLKDFEFRMENLEQDIEAVRRDSCKSVRAKSEKIVWRF